MVSGKAFRRLKAIPKVTGSLYKSEQAATVSWSFNAEEENLTKGFEIYRGPDIGGPYELISGILPPGTREFGFEMIPSNYIIVKALGLKEGDFTVSGAYFIQQPDITPPEKPADLQGKIDSAGAVTLWWKPNTDKDLEGYFVYWSRLKGEEFVLMNVTPIIDTIFHDTISLNTFVEHINYRVRAIDKRYNYSKPSDTLVLKLPDILKPVSPYFLTYSVHADSITLNWVNSSSSDVASHFLFRKAGDETQWTQIARYDTLGVTRFTDHNMEEKKRYSYMLMAVDDDGLKSDPSRPATLYVPPYKAVPPVEKFSVTLDREKMKVSIKWKKNETVKGYQLYKQEGEYAPFLYKYFDAKDSKFTDVRIKPFLTYTYRIRSVGYNGLYSDYEAVSVSW